MSEIVTYTCEPGYHFAGHHTQFGADGVPRTNIAVKCISHGNDENAGIWSEDEPRCIPSSCILPHTELLDPLKSTCLTAEVAPGTKCELRCLESEHATMGDKHMFECIHGRWDSDPRCHKPRHPNPIPGIPQPLTLKPESDVVLKGVFVQQMPHRIDFDYSNFGESESGFRIHGDTIPGGSRLRGQGIPLPNSSQNFTHFTYWFDIDAGNAGKSTFWIYRDHKAENSGGKIQEATLLAHSDLPTQCLETVCLDLNAYRPSFEGGAGTLNRSQLHDSCCGCFVTATVLQTSSPLHVIVRGEKTQVCLHVPPLTTDDSPSQQQTKIDISRRVVCQEFSRVKSVRTEGNKSEEVLEVIVEYRAEKTRFFREDGQKKFQVAAETPAAGASAWTLSVAFIGAFAAAVSIFVIWRKRKTSSHAEFYDSEDENETQQA